MIVFLQLERLFDIVLFLAVDLDVSVHLCLFGAVF